jgi:anti-sigma factor ChrR (cupin superfamily)
MQFPIAHDRKVVNYKSAPFRPYGLQGREQSDIDWCDISWDDESESGFFLVRFAPGGSSIPHEHRGFEEFVVLDGSLTDHDGHVYRQGDCVSLGPGSRHYSTSENGATVAVVIRGGFRTLTRTDL